MTSKLIEILNYYKSRNIVNISTFNPIEITHLELVKRKLDINLDENIIKLLKYSNGINAYVFSHFGILNKKIADITQLNDNLTIGKREDIIIYFASSGENNYGYKEEDKKVYKIDFSEIAMDKELIADNINHFYEKVAGKLDFIFSKKLYNDVYTIEDEDLPENIKNW